LNKIQIKYSGQTTNNNSINCICSSSTNHTTNKHLTTYEEDVDYIAFYLVPLDKCILVPIEIIENRKSMVFRTELPLNGQRKGINFVDDYTFDKILNPNLDES
jgi:hypothetical protein